MRKKSHLSLVENSIGKSRPDVLEFSQAKGKESVLRNSVQQRLCEAESELSTMQNVTYATLFMMRSLPIDQLTMRELSRIHDVFREGETVLDVYEMELAHISSARLSSREIRQYTKIRNILKELRLSLPEVKDHVAGVLAKVQTKGSGKIGSKNRARTGLKAVAPANGIQLKVMLKGSRPPIWRRLLVPGNCRLCELHFTIQQSMGWSDKHLHGFYIGGKEYSVRTDNCDEDSTTLQQFNLRPGNKFSYEYDFDESWMHTVEVEKILDVPQDALACIDGRRACPPEDCGGLEGFYRNLAILKNPAHPEYQEVKEWMGDFDPTGM